MLLKGAAKLNRRNALDVKGTIGSSRIKPLRRQNLPSTPAQLEEKDEGEARDRTTALKLYRRGRDSRSGPGMSLANISLVSPVKTCLPVIGVTAWFTVLQPDRRLAAIRPERFEPPTDGLESGRSETV
jgi:hypothetical protein